VHAVTSWLPLVMFVVLFGLSMDYHVFILSRIRESYDRTGHTDQAVAHGIKISAGVVTAAAAVMVFVFLTFATLSDGVVQGDGRGPGRGRAARRDHRPGGPAARHDEAARPLELVPAPLA
jgi:MMPL family